MPRTNVNGDLSSVKNVFLALITRLNNIKDGIIDLAELYSGYEDSQKAQIG